MEKTAGIIETRVIRKAGWQVAGEQIRFDPRAAAKPSENTITELWKRFDASGIPAQKGSGYYGLCLSEEDCFDRPFDYLAAVEVEALGDLPEGMVSRQMPGGLYAVVTRQGIIDELSQAMSYFHEHWLPQSGYTSRPGGAIEYYDERYLGNGDPDSIMELWFPIELLHETALENRIASVFVHVGDLRRAAEWYSRLLGLPLLEERLNGGPVYWLELPGTHLILDSDSHNQVQPGWEEWQQPRLMLAARNIEQAVHQLQGAGAELIGGLEDHGTMAYANFRDPEGNILMACWTQKPSEDMADTGGGPIRPRIGGVFLDVRDLPAAARWYSELLGLQLDEPSAGETIYSVPVSRGAALLLDRNRHANQETFTELFYLETDDFEAALAYVKNLGCELADGPNYFDDLSEFALLDPDGNRIVIAQMKG